MGLKLLDVATTFALGSAVVHEHNLINLGKHSFVTKESDITLMLCDRLHVDG